MSREWTVEDRKEVSKARNVAIEAHRGQTDLAGQPYITHPQRVAKMVEGKTDTIAALLHDVVEDSDMELEEIQETFGDDVAEAVGVLTRDRSYETYMEYIYDVRGHGRARRVKIADLKDNMKCWRIPEPDEDDWDRWKKYHRAWRTLKKVEDCHERERY